MQNEKENPNPIFQPYGNETPGVIRVTAYPVEPTSTTPSAPPLYTQPARVSSFSGAGNKGGDSVSLESPVQAFPFHPHSSTVESSSNQQFSLRVENRNLRESNTSHDQNIIPTIPFHLRTLYYVYGVTLLTELSIAVAISANIGATVVIADAVISLFRFIALLLVCCGMELSYLKRFFLFISIFSGVDIVFPSIFLHNMYGVAGCVKIAYTSNKTDYYGDSAYELDTYNCVEDLYYECYCYNPLQDFCLTVRAVNDQSASAKSSCGEVVDSIPALSIVLLLLSIMNFLLALTIYRGMIRLDSHRR